MTVLHVEDNGITRACLAHLLGVKNGRLDGHVYIATGIVAAAQEQLSQGTVCALVLDIGLNVKWDNQYMRRALRRLIFAPEHRDPPDEPGLSAHRLALHAMIHRVPCTLLTNWPDYLNEAGEYSTSALREAFHAEAVFRKDETGICACAAWVRQQLA
jgi:hypothetical protein